MGIYIALGCGAALLILVAVLIVRTLRFRPRPTAVGDIAPVAVDTEKTVAALAEMVRCRTVSSTDKTAEDAAEFAKFEALLPRLFPRIHAACLFERVGDRALLYRLKGQSPDAPTVLMAHYDVVPVEESGWSRPPFDAVYEDGVLWGRGTLDTKSTLCAAMQALETLLEQGYVPAHDLYLAFAGDEEVSGTGAPAIVDLFEARGITPGLVLDEGGAVVEKVFPGVKRSCAVIGIAEKGMLNLEFSCESGGGHASAPKPHTPVGVLSRACTRVERHPFGFRVTPAAHACLDTLARHSSFAYRLIFANLWLFGGVLDVLGRSTGGELNALTRTTCAFTQMEGSAGMNVIPPRARMVANLRLLPGETMESARDRIARVVGDEAVQLRIISGQNPSRVSLVEGGAWERVCAAVAGTWPEAVVSPYLMLACSDSRHWGRISDRVYRFSAMALSGAERATIHGNDERITAAALTEAVAFYTRLLKNS